MNITKVIEILEQIKIREGDIDVCVHKTGTEFQDIQNVIVGKFFGEKEKYCIISDRKEIK